MMTMKAVQVRSIDGYDKNVAGTRAAAREQPPIVKRSQVYRPNKKFFCYAEAARARTGKAEGWTFERGGPFEGPSEEAVSSLRREWIMNFMQHVPTEKRAREETAQEAGELRRSKREKGEKGESGSGLLSGPRKHMKRRAGPGRGHRFEPAQPPPRTMEELLTPPAEDSSGNWLERLSAQRQWQARASKVLEEKIKQLHLELLKKDDMIARQSISIEKLRMRVRCDITFSLWPPSWPASPHSFPAQVSRKPC